MLAFSADPSVTQQADKACLSSCRGCDGGKERNIKVMHGELLTAFLNVCKKLTCTSAARARTGPLR